MPLDARARLDPASSGTFAILTPKSIGALSIVMPISIGPRATSTPVFTAVAQPVISDMSGTSRADNGLIMLNLYNVANILLFD